MNLTTLSQRSTHEQTRQRILAKADELFRHFGFAKTTVADIAAPDPDDIVRVQHGRLALGVRFRAGFGDAAGAGHSGE